MSYTTKVTHVARRPFGSDKYEERSTRDTLFRGAGTPGPRICTSADQSKICVQNIGIYGQSHIRIMDSNVTSNERYFMNPLRNSIVIGISNCGKNIIVARQSSRRSFKIIRERGLLLHVHELSSEIFDGFYLEDSRMALILTHLGEIFKIDVSRCYSNHALKNPEALVLKQCQTVGEKVKMRLASLDVFTNLLWVYVECEDTRAPLSRPSSSSSQGCSTASDSDETVQPELTLEHRYKSNNPFLSDSEDSIPSGLNPQSRINYQRKIIIIDIITFDIFSAFTVQTSFGNITKLRASLVAFCQLSSPTSNHFSSRIISIGPTGRYEHLLSFSDVVDFVIDVPDGCKQSDFYMINEKIPSTNQKLSTINRFFMKLKSSIQEGVAMRRTVDCSIDCSTSLAIGYESLTSYYRSLMRRHSTTFDSASFKTDYSQRDLDHSGDSKSTSDCSANDLVIPYS